MKTFRCLMAAALLVALVACKENTARTLVLYYSQSGTTMMKKVETSLVPGAVLMICSEGRSVLAVEWQAPETTPSASLFLTIMQAKYM